MVEDEEVIRGLVDQVLRAEGYDVVLAADVLEHVRDPERLIRQMTDCLTDNGVVLVTQGKSAKDAWNNAVKTIDNNLDQ